MHLSLGKIRKFIRRLSQSLHLRRRRPTSYSPSPPDNDPVSTSGCISHSEVGSSKNKQDEENTASRTHTGRNAVKFALQTLSKVSNNIPLGGVINSVIDPLLDLADRIEETQANREGLVELAARIGRLLHIIGEKRSSPDEVESASVVENVFREELESIAADLNAARSQGTIQQFFNSRDTAGSLAAHNDTLARLISELTLEKMQDVQQSLKVIEEKLGRLARDGNFEDVRPELFGGTGGKGGASDDIGGEGGFGQGTRLPIEDVNEFKRVLGGTGGEGGFGPNKGGFGGMGQATQFGGRLLPAFASGGKGLPNLPLVEFCHTYDLDEDILERLREQGFKMSAALYGLKDDDLMGVGFKVGHVAEVKRALREFVEHVEAGRPPTPG
ncbi:hypothetical protein FB45DRAFT_873803 [Roridomyces roridus]|uniref:SAM domain-containing protein n=1 Tax=Roridomyces roridus TaxID=1738132 RepID=A0AAD7BAR9_9AGAR|nr:hypothetical protein FB45DRAFT_873803 [Roridomyces roridus]